MGGGLGIVIIVIALLSGVDPGSLLNLAPTTSQQTTNNAPVADAREEELKHFTSVVLADTEDIWGRLFAQSEET